jgi:endonuclease YncB( thermonuclease family)
MCRIIPLPPGRRSANRVRATPHRRSVEPALRFRRRRPARRAWLRFLRRRAAAVLLLCGALGLGMGVDPSRLAGADWLSALTPSAMGREAPASQCRVTRVVDGDTVRARCGSAGEVRVRLMGFDTPEVFSPGCTAEKTKGDAATLALRRLIGAADRIAFDFHGEDRYGRALAVMRLDGRDVAALMIDAGLARPYAGGRRPAWCS